MSDPEHWSALFGEMLFRFVSAVAWRIEYLDRRAGISSCRVSDDLDPVILDCLKRAMRKSQKQLGTQNTSYDWHDASFNPDSDAGITLKVFVFRFEISTDREVRSAMVLDQNAFQESNFGSEAEFLAYCHRVATFMVRGADAMHHEEIFQKIAGSISLGGIVADRNGKLVMNIGGESGEVPDCLKPVFESPECAKKLLRQVVLDEVQACDKSGKDRKDRPAAEGLISTGGQDRSVLHVIPIRDSRENAQDGRVLFAVLEPFTARCPSSQSLKRVYALTPAEARVVEKLVRGLPIKEISRVLKLSDNTVRTYLKRSFEKVGVSSQQQLIYEVCGMSTEAHGSQGGASEATAAE